MRIVNHLSRAVAALTAVVAVAAPSAAGARQDDETVVTAVSCIVREVAVFADRMHIFCRPPPGPSSPSEVNSENSGWMLLSARYFAVPTDDPLAAPAAALAAQAVAADRQVRIELDFNPGHNPPGCLQSDCRRLLSVRLREG